MNKTLENIKRDLNTSGIKPHKRITAKTPLDVRLWLEENPDNHSAQWLTKQKRPVTGKDDYYFFQMSSRNSSIFVPLEVHARCFVKPSAWPALFEWDAKAEAKAAKKKPVTLAKTAATKH
jgi:hypothetical protein